MKLTFVGVLLVLLATTCFAQNDYNLGWNLIEKKNQYLKAVDSTQTLLKRYNKAHHIKPGAPNSSILDQALSLYKSFIGEEYVVHWKFKPEAAIHNNTIAHFSLAVPYIVEQAKSRQVVMINEDHNIPKHRLLTYNLLDDFYKLGFRYLAVETLDINDFASTQKININSGFYTAEPNMGNLLKKAQQLGFKLVAYESSDESEDGKDQHFYSENLREIHQAKNLYHVLVKDPSAKILVHAGHGHVWEHTDSDLIMMAEYFKIISGIDPLSINQSINVQTEFTARLDKSADYVAKGEPYVVLDGNHHPRVSDKDNKGDYDLLVTWPTPAMVNGRKDYMLWKSGIKPYLIQVSPGDAGNLLQVMSSNPEENIPIDQFVVKSSIRQYASALPEGEYVIQLTDKNGSVIWKKPISVTSQPGNDPGL